MPNFKRLGSITMNFKVFTEGPLKETVSLLKHQILTIQEPQN